jgi:hypothetical protein
VLAYGGAQFPYTDGKAFFGNHLVDAVVHPVLPV